MVGAEVGAFGVNQLEGLGCHGPLGPRTPKPLSLLIAPPDHSSLGARTTSSHVLLQHQQDTQKVCQVDGGAG